jgi:hypothetical protein
VKGEGPAAGVIAPLGPFGTGASIVGQAAWRVPSAGRPGASRVKFAPGEDLATPVQPSLGANTTDLDPRQARTSTVPDDDGHRRAQLLVRATIRPFSQVAGPSGSPFPGEGRGFESRRPLDEVTGQCQRPSLDGLRGCAGSRGARLSPVALQKVAHRFLPHCHRSALPPLGPTGTVQPPTVNPGRHYGSGAVRRSCGPQAVSEPKSVLYSNRTHF